VWRSHNLETLYGAIEDGAIAVRIPKHARYYLRAPPAPLVMSSLNDVDDGGVIAVTECRDGNTARAG
jgi:hypothetical protein